MCVTFPTPGLLHLLCRVQGTSFCKLSECHRPLPASAESFTPGETFPSSPLEHPPCPVTHQLAALVPSSLHWPRLLLYIGLWGHLITSLSSLLLEIRYHVELCLQWPLRGGTVCDPNRKFTDSPHPHVHPCPFMSSPSATPVGSTLKPQFSTWGVVSPTPASGDIWQCLVVTTRGDATRI